MASGAKHCCHILSCSVSIFCFVHVDGVPGVRGSEELRARGDPRGGQIGRAPHLPPEESTPGSDFSVGFECSDLEPAVICRGKRRGKFEIGYETLTDPLVPLIPGGNSRRL